MPRVKSNTFERTVKFLDENFNEVTDKATGTLVLAKSKSEAESLFGNDDAKILDALNNVLREQQIRAAMEAKTGGIEMKYVLAFIRPMRMTEPHVSIEKEADQTASILKDIKSTPILLAMLKSYCKNRAEDTGEETEETA